MKGGDTEKKGSGIHDMKRSKDTQRNPSIFAHLVRLQELDVRLVLRRLEERGHHHLHIGQELVTQDLERGVI
jgi:hypothetical protein